MFKVIFWNDDNEIWQSIDSDGAFYDLDEAIDEAYAFNERNNSKCCVISNDDDCIQHLCLDEDGCECIEFDRCAVR